MNRYIQQLIQDLAEAEANPNPEPDYAAMPYEEFVEEMMVLEERTKISGKQLLNVSYEVLPPAEKLTDEQTQLLLKAILNALSAKGVCICFPGKNVPEKLKYTVVKDMFKEGFEALPGWIQDFCTGWCPDCEFAEYCEACKESWTEEELEKERKKHRE